jgi:hypothetical protein
MSDDATHIFIDGSNVVRSGAWITATPQRDDDARLRLLIDACASWVGSAGMHATLFFDGTLPGITSRSIPQLLDVRASGSRPADDLLEQAASEARASGATYWIVSADRAIADVAGAHAQRVLAPAEFVTLILQPPEEGSAAQEGTSRGTQLGDTLDDDTRDALERLRRGNL